MSSEVLAAACPPVRGILGSLPSRTPILSTSAPFPAQKTQHLPLVCPAALSQAQCGQESAGRLPVCPLLQPLHPPWPSQGSTVFLNLTGTLFSS